MDKNIKQPTPQEMVAGTNSAPSDAERTEQEAGTTPFLASAVSLHALLGDR